MTPCGIQCLTSFLVPRLAAWADFLGRDVEERADGGQAATSLLSPGGGGQNTEPPAVTELVKNISINKTNTQHTHRTETEEYQQSKPRGVGGCGEGAGARGACRARPEQPCGSGCGGLRVLPESLGPV